MNWEVADLAVAWTTQPLLHLFTAVVLVLLKLSFYNNVAKCIQNNMWTIQVDGCFYPALFSALEQTHCTRMWLYMSD